MTEEEWDAVINVHLKGTFAPSRWAVAYWREQAKAGQPVSGRIINTTSVSGIYGNPGQTNYGAAKAGIAAFTIIAALEVARYGVTVNAVAPVALTRMTEGLGPAPETDEAREARAPHWIAPIVTWLASEESAGVTGRVFEASGQMLAIAEGWSRGPTTTADRRPDAARRRRRQAARREPGRTPAWTARPGSWPQITHRDVANTRHRSTDMPLNPDAVGAQSEPADFSWTSKDALLYAVSIGAGADELAFTTENTKDVTQQVFPTFPVVMGYGAGGRSVMADIGTFNPALLVHGQQAVTLHRPIPVEGTATVVAKLTDMYDKGKAAVVVTESQHDDRRRAAVHDPLVGVHPRRGRLGRRPRPVRPAERPAGAAAGPRGHLPDVARPGVRLPAQRRPQPAAHRPVVRRRRRLRPADPPRPVQLRVHRPGAAARRCAAPTRPASTTSRPASPRRCCPARR